MYLLRICILLTLPSGFCIASGPSGQNPVATVNGEAISPAQLELALRPQLEAIEERIRQMRQGMLNKLIDNLLLEQAARSEGLSADRFLESRVESVSVPAADVDRAFQSSRDNFRGILPAEAKYRIRRTLEDNARAAALTVLLDKLRSTAQVTNHLMAGMTATLEAAGREGPSLGPDNAPVTIIEFSDFECPYCRAAQPLLQRLREKWPGKVRHVFKHFPLDQHPARCPPRVPAGCGDRASGDHRYMTPPRLTCAALLLVTAACQVEPGDRVETSSQEITNGTPASASQFPTVVAITNNGLCTGTLVAPDLVMTAAHCVDPATLGLGSQAQVTAATDVHLDDLDLTAAPSGRVIAAADTRKIASFTQPGSPDIGLIFLSEDVTDRDPSPIHWDPATLSGATVDIVGFGETETGAFGRLMFATDKPLVSCAGFGASDTDFICMNQQAGPGICSGDSGGPAFATIDGVERVVGITSFGDLDCTQLGAHFRTDSPSARSFLQTNAPELLCADDGVCDPACSVPDLDCRRPCEGDGECEDGEYCAPDGNCAPDPYSDGGVGSECGNNGDCFSGMCVMAGNDETRCVDECGDGLGCASGFECTSNVCWPESGGCAAGGGPAGPAALMLALAGLLGLRRRRTPASR